MNKKYIPFKRTLDILCSILGIFFCLGLLWWWILIINVFVTKGHPFFTQERIGKNKKTFKILKFRSMKNDVDSYLAPFNMDDKTQEDMETKFGHFLRKTQLDETLQLFNIFFGSMSFVGYRPCASKNEEELVNERDNCNPSVFTIKPGLTGLAQVYLYNDRHNPVLKAKYDYEYLCKMSFWLDAKIFFITIVRLFGIGK